MRSAILRQNLQWCSYGGVPGLSNNVRYLVTAVVVRVWVGAVRDEQDIDVCPANIQPVSRESSSVSHALEYVQVLKIDERQLVFCTINNES